MYEDDSIYESIIDPQSRCQTEIEDPVYDSIDDPPKQQLQDENLYESLCSNVEPGLTSTICQPRDSDHSRSTVFSSGSDYSNSNRGHSLSTSQDEKSNPNTRLKVIPCENDSDYDSVIQAEPEQVSGKSSARSSADSEFSTMKSDTSLPPPKSVSPLPRQLRKPSLPLLPSHVVPRTRPPPVAPKPKFVKSMSNSSITSEPVENTYAKMAQPSPLDRPLTTRSQTISANFSSPSGSVQGLNRSNKSSTGERPPSFDLPPMLEIEDGACYESLGGAGAEKGAPISAGTIAIEIIESERSHLGKLTILQEMNDQLLIMFREANNTERVDQIKTIFKDVGSLHAFHTNFVRELDLIASRSDVHYRIAPVFLQPEISPLFNMYKFIILISEQTTQLLAQCLSQDHNFSECCSRILMYSDCSDITVTYLFESAVTRVSQLRDLLKKLYDSLVYAGAPEMKIGEAQNAFNLMDRLINSFDKEKLDAKRLMDVQAARNLLDGALNPLTISSEFLQSTPVVVCNKRQARPFRDCHLFLFNDFLILTEPPNKSGKHKVIKQISINIIKLTSKDPEWEDRENRMLRVAAHEKSLDLVFETEEKKQEWYAYIASSCAERKQTRLSSTRSLSFGSIVPWKSEEFSGKQCSLCSADFKIFQRPKHRCYKCLQSICDKCSKSEQHTATKTKQRVCEHCSEHTSPPPQTFSRRRVSTFSSPASLKSKMTSVREGTLVFECCDDDGTWSEPLEAHCVLEENTILHIFASDKDKEPLWNLRTLFYSKYLATEDVNCLRVILEHTNSSQKYALTAPSVEVRDGWLADLLKVLQN